MIMAIIGFNCGMKKKTGSLTEASDVKGSIDVVVSHLVIQ
jgi:hypothetical protein